MEVYCVFYQLDNYYDHNDKTLFQVVDNEEKAIKLVEKYPQHDLCYEKWKVE